MIGEDGGAEVTALTLDMSDAGSAYFNNNVGIGTTSPSGGSVGGRVLHLVNSGATASVRVDRSEKDNEEARKAQEDRGLARYGSRP